MVYRPPSAKGIFIRGTGRTTGPIGGGPSVRAQRPQTPPTLHAQVAGFSDAGNWIVPSRARSNAHFIPRRCGCPGRYSLRPGPSSGKMVGECFRRCAVSTGARCANGPVNVGTCSSAMNCTFHIGGCILIPPTPMDSADTATPTRQGEWQWTRVGRLRETPHWRGWGRDGESCDDEEDTRERRTAAVLAPRRPTAIGRTTSLPET